jgi:hypothetical protein
MIPGRHAAASWSDPLGGATDIVSPVPRELSFVMIRPVRRPIDGGGVFGLACRALGPARPTREEAAPVRGTSWGRG